MISTTSPSEVSDEERVGSTDEYRPSAAACGNSSAGEVARTGATRLVSSASPIPTVDPVVHWNRILIGIVRTPGAQPATVHPTRAFAMLHAALYDAVNAID